MNLLPTPRQMRKFLSLLTLLCGALQAQAQVGMSRLMVGDLPVTLVYPTLAAEAPLVLGLFVLKVALDAAPVEPAAGRRRLIVMSHGTGGNALSDHDLAATLARAGFVVAQPEHAGDNFRDMSGTGPVSWARRPQEVSRVIDALAQHPTWGPRLQLDRVGVHGMSAGGVTALSLAGAQWSVLQLVRHCQAHANEDAGFCFSGLPTAEAQATRRASYERARGVMDADMPAELRAWQGGRAPRDSALRPTMTSSAIGPAGTRAFASHKAPSWPSCAGSAPQGGMSKVAEPHLLLNADPRPDPRVAAVSLAVPAAAMFSAESLSRIAVPVGLLRAGRDEWLLPRFHADHVLRHCGQCTLLARLEGAGHLDLLSPWPQAVARSVAAQQARGGSPEPGFDVAERTAAFQAVAVFFRQQLP